MQANFRRTLGGSFVVRELGSGAWQLIGGGSTGAVIYFTGTDPDAARTLRDARFSRVAVEWRDDGALASLTSSTGTEVLKMRHAFVHEPLAHLYESLPLASFDEAARRFWRRVFRLVRIPGGRHLLRLIARRARVPKSSPRELDHRGQ